MDDSERRERAKPGLLVCVLCAAVVREGLPLFFCVCLFLILKCLNVNKIKIKSRSGPLLSFTVVSPLFILPELLRGTRDR